MLENINFVFDTFIFFGNFKYAVFFYLTLYFIPLNTLMMRIEEESVNENGENFQENNEYREMRAYRFRSQLFLWSMPRSSSRASPSVTISAHYYPYQ